METFTQQTSGVKPQMYEFTSPSGARFMYCGDYISVPTDPDGWYKIFAHGRCCAMVPGSWAFGEYVA